MNSVDYIKKWLGEKETISFFLPSDPLGRPFDNSYVVIDVFESCEGLNIILSNNIRFLFKGDLCIKDEVCNLYIYDFEKIGFFVSDSEISSFDKGEFCFVGF